MKTLKLSWFSIIFTITFLISIISLGLGLGGSPAPGPPTPDKKLSPPIIQKPIYRCAQIIAFSGADRDSKIIVYVNGSKVTEKNLWLGWGTVVLPNPLSIGDIVSAAQVVNNQISWQTRDPVTVIDIPPNMRPRGKLNKPKIASPIYECQKVITVTNVLEGATVFVRNVNADTWKGMTPGVYIFIFRPSVRLEEKWFNSFQEICKDPRFSSEWSDKVRVQKKPSSLPGPTIRKPLVYGNDALIIDDVIPGAQIDIYAENSSGSLLVGSRPAAAKAGNIVRINPPFDTKYDYHPYQSLCDITSKKTRGISPIEEVPPPNIMGPICDGDYYVKICNTQIMSTVKVYANGVQVTQAAGNGDCITIALGNKTTFSKNQKITAKQFVAGRPNKKPSATVTVQVDGAPNYDPAYWNDPKHVFVNNCYNYGVDIRTDTYAQPGRAHGIWHERKSKNITCPFIEKGAIDDGLKKNLEKECKGCSHLAALFMAPGKDYHWYRLDNNGRWSQKPADSPVSDKDASGSWITNVETADHNYKGPDYFIHLTEFCGYYCVDKKIVDIK